MSLDDELIDTPDGPMTWAEWKKKHPNDVAPNMIYWGKYVAHDNNRDGLGMALALTRNMMKTFLEYHPTILHDLHESVPFLYTSTIRSRPSTSRTGVIKTITFRLIAWINWLSSTASR